MKTTNKILAILIIFPLLALLGGFYAQYQMSMQPCPLCIFQRIIYAALFFWGVIVFALPQKISKWLAIVADFTALLGLIIAGRQVFMQYFPSPVKASCGADLEGLIEMFSWIDTIIKVMNGYGDCARIDSFFLGLSIAFWSLFLFGLLSALWSLYFMLRFHEDLPPKFAFKK